MATYKQQFDKLTEAYIKNEVNPYKNCACFIGNLLEGDGWANARNPMGGRGKGTLNYPFCDLISYSQAFIREKSDGMYSPLQILDMENNFLKILWENTINRKQYVESIHEVVLAHPNYEEALFKAFSSTLDLLKQIHIEAGEDVEETTFLKREVPVNA